MKKRFAGPCWLMLIIGLFLSVLISFYVSALQNMYGHGFHLALWRLMIWPTVVFVEAAIYWLIRKRNKSYAFSWAHVGIFGAAFLFNVILAIMTIMHYQVRYSMDDRIQRQIVLRQEQYLFWGLVILAHVFFAAVLIRSLGAQAADVKSSADPASILDDVV